MLIQQKQAYRRSRRPKSVGEDPAFTLIAKSSQCAGWGVGTATKLTALYWAVVPYLAAERKRHLDNLIGAAAFHRRQEVARFPQHRRQFLRDWQALQAGLYHELNKLIAQLADSPNQRLSLNSEDDERLICAILASHLQEDHRDTLLVYKAVLYGDIDDVRAMLNILQS